MKATSTVGSGLRRTAPTHSAEDYEEQLSHRLWTSSFEPEFSACQDAPGLLVRHPDQRLLVDGHQLISNLKPSVLQTDTCRSTGARVEVETNVPAP